MLKIQAGLSFVANYTENGHVTKDSLAPDNLPHPGNYTWYLAANSAGTPSPMLTYGSLSTAGRVVATGNFDDGKCAEDATKGRAGPRNCQSVVVVPSTLSAGTYELIWLWNFPKVAGVVEMYSSCMDIQVLGSSSVSSIAAGVIKVASADTVAIVAGTTSAASDANLLAAVDTPVTKYVMETVYVTATPTPTTSSRSKSTVTVTNVTSIYTTVTPGSSIAVAMVTLLANLAVALTSASSMQADGTVMTTFETTIGATGTQAPGIYVLEVPVTVTPQANPLADAANAVPTTTMKKVTVTIPTWSNTTAS